MGKRLWQIDENTDSAVTLSVKLDDGEIGYPGNMAVQLKYHLQATSVLDIRMQATADAYLTVDDELIPTGEVRSVVSTGFDIRQLAAVS